MRKFTQKAMINPFTNGSKPEVQHWKTIDLSNVISDITDLVMASVQGGGMAKHEFTNPIFWEQLDAYADEWFDKYSVVSAEQTNSMPNVRFVANGGFVFTAAFMSMYSGNVRTVAVVSTSAVLPYEGMLIKGDLVFQRSGNDGSGFIYCVTTTTALA